MNIAWFKKNFKNASHDVYNIVWNKKKIKPILTMFITSYGIKKKKNLHLPRIKPRHLKCRGWQLILPRCSLYRVVYLFVGRQIYTTTTILPYIITI